MPKAPASGKKIGGLSQRNAVILFVVVAVGVFLYMRHRSTANAATQLSTTSVPTDGTQAYPAQTSDSTGGASGSGSGDSGLASLLAQFTTNPPYYYYNTGGNTTTTYNYNPAPPMQTSPAPPPGGTNTGGGGGGYVDVFPGVPATPGPTFTPGVTSGHRVSPSGWQPNFSLPTTGTGGLALPGKVVLA